MQGLGLRAMGLEFWGFGGLGFRIQEIGRLRIQIQGLRFKVQGLGFRV